MVFFCILLLFGARSSRLSHKKRKSRFRDFLFYGGDDQTRTDYLYVANVSLYRVSYIPIFESFIIIQHFIKIFNRFRAISEKNFFCKLFFVEERMEKIASLDSCRQIVYNIL